MKSVTLDENIVIEAESVSGLEIEVRWSSWHGFDGYGLYLEVCGCETWQGGM